MLTSWLVIWMLFMILFLLTPVTYGWGYRRWGVPYPRYIQKRRVERSVAHGNSDYQFHLSWGWIGDMVWISLFIWVVWAAIAFWPS